MKRGIRIAAAFVLSFAMLCGNVTAAALTDDQLAETAAIETETEEQEDSQENTLEETQAETAETEGLNETEASSEAEQVSYVPETIEEVTLSDEDWDNDEAFSAYVEYKMYEDMPAAAETKPSLKAAKKPLDGQNALLYEALKTQIEKVANGEETSTVFTIPVTELGLQESYTDTELGLDSLIENGAVSGAAKTAISGLFTYDGEKVVNCLLADLPYDLYWFDKSKTGGYSYGNPGYTVSYSSTDSSMTFSGGVTFTFYVAKEYSVSDTTKTTEVNPSYATAVENAVANARSIVETNAGLSDYNKLVAYREAICDRVSYNDAAAENDDTAYGNPWQLIWVFDDDTTTNVVCEGYSKAFQYLCDLTTFDNQTINSIIVTGTMDGGTGAGGHMWNIVTMEDGKHYLVDVTNCDGEADKQSIGYPDKLFLAGTENGNCEDGYTFYPNNGTVFYKYYDLSSLYDASDLTLAGSNYDISTVIKLSDLLTDIPQHNDTETGTLYYYYRQLSDVEKVMYNLMVQSIDSQEYSFSFDVANSDGYTNSDISNAVSVAMEAMRYDHPWCTIHISHSYGIGCYEKEEGVEYTITLTANDYSEYQKRKAEAKLQQIVSTMGTGDRFTQLARLLTYISRNITYDYDSAYLIGGTNSNSANTIIGGLVFDSAVCEGFSYLIKHACEICGIPCLVICGEYPSEPNYGHMWNYIQMENGEWYLIDGTDICKGTSEAVLETSLYKYPLKGRDYKWSDNRYSGNNGLSSKWEVNESIQLPEIAIENYVYSGQYDWNSYEEAELDFDDSEITFLYSTNDDGTCTITGYEGEKADNLIIPEMIDGYEVTAIGDNAFYKADGFSGNLEIPDSVTSIGAFAFYRCSGLNGELRLPHNLKSIGQSAFMECAFNCQLSLPETLVELGENAFYDCCDIYGTVNIPEGISEVDHRFSYCSKIESFVVSEANPVLCSVDGVIYSKDRKELCVVPCNLKKLDILGTVTKIHNSACVNCEGLRGTKLIIPEGVEFIGDWAFLGTNFSGDLYIPDTVTYIGDSAFFVDGSESVFGGEVHLSKSLVHLGKLAFANCHFTGDLFIPDSLSEIVADEYSTPFHANNFSYYICSCQNEMFLDFYSQHYMESKNGLMVTHTPTEEVEWEWEEDYTEANLSLFCTDCQKSILSKAVLSYEMVEEPKLDEDGLGVFRAKVYNTDGSISTDERTIVLHDGTTILQVGQPSAAVINNNDGYALFAFIPPETSYYVFESFGDFDTYAELCDEEGNVIASNDNYGGGKNYYINYNLMQGTQYYYKVRFTDQSQRGSFAVTLRKNNTCGENLTWKLENGILTISGSGEMWDMHYTGADTPWGDDKYLVTSIVIEDGVSSIGENAFRFCSNVQNVKIPDSVLKIGKEAFWQCREITEIDLGAGVKTIGNGAFGWCTSLTSIRAINVESIERSAFSCCSSLKTFIMPESVKSLGAFVFNECTGLENVVLPDGLSEVSEALFYRCNSLKKVTIPSSIITIDNKAFLGCDSLSDVYYCGTEEQWNTIIVSSENEPLSKATIHYSENKAVIAQAASLNLDGTIGVNFKMTLPHYILENDAVSAVFMYKGKEYPRSLQGITQNSQGYYVFTFRVPAKEFSNIIGLKFVNGKDTISMQYPSGNQVPNDLLEFSPEKYCEKIQDTNKVKPLIDALRNYCAAAYIGLNDTDDIQPSFTEDCDFSIVSAETLKPYKASSEGTVSGLSINSYSLTLESTVEVNLKFDLAADYSIEDYTFVLDGNEVDAENINQYWVVSINDIAAKDLDTVHVLQVFHEEESMGLYCSGLSYGYTVLNRDLLTTEMRDTVRALYLYNQAANAYFN